GVLPDCATWVPAADAERLLAAGVARKGFPFAAGQPSVPTCVRSHRPFAMRVHGERPLRSAGLTPANAGCPAAQDLPPAAVPAFRAQRKSVHFALAAPRT